MLDTWHSVRIHVSTHVNQWVRVKVWTWLNGPLVWHEASVQGNIWISSAILTTIGNSKARTASGSQWGMGSQAEFHQSKRKVCLDVLNVCHRFFLPLGLLLKLIEHVQQHVHPPSIVCASNQYFVALRKKCRDLKGRPWNELCPICPYWSCFRRFIVLRCSHLSLCWSILSSPESWLSASICGISDKIHGVTLESACFEAEEEWYRKIWIC